MVEPFGRELSSDSLLGLLLASLSGKLDARQATAWERYGGGWSSAAGGPSLDPDQIERCLADGWACCESQHRAALLLAAPFEDPPQTLIRFERSAARPFERWEAEFAALFARSAAAVARTARREREARREADRCREMEETLRALLDATSGSTGAEFFPLLVGRLAAALHMKFAFATDLLPGRRSARMLSFWTGESFLGEMQYDLEHTPCEGVIRGEIGFYPRDIQDLFPKHEDLVTLGIESYLGVPMLASTGEVIGHIAVMDSRPMEETWLTLPILKTFSVRGGAELERHKDQQRLRQALDEVSRLEKRLRAENTYLREEIGDEHNFREIIGDSPALLALLKKVEQVGATDSTVLILGETGVGKELIARALHDRSRRRDRPLVKVNCGAISAGLVESELFGHVRGAFTGALDKRVGRFELADGGTIFLDEVGELPPETQVALLRVLQEHEFEPVGSSNTKKVDVRVIAATNRDLGQAVGEGRFRADLFYRLNVFPLEAPPLRERVEDIPQLAAYFAGQCARRFGKDFEAIEDESLERLQSYSWPGNVRELQNVVERAVVLSDGPLLRIPSGLLPIAQPPPEKKATVAAPAESRGALVDFERNHILTALERANWVIEGPRGAARELDLHPNTLRSRMRKLGLSRPAAPASGRPTSWGGS